MEMIWPRDLFSGRSSHPASFFILMNTPTSSFISLISLVQWSLRNRQILPVTQNPIGGFFSLNEWLFSYLSSSKCHRQLYLVRYVPSTDNISLIFCRLSYSGDRWWLVQGLMFSILPYRLHGGICPNGCWFDILGNLDICITDILSFWKYCWSADFRWWLHSNFGRFLIYNSSGLHRFHIRQRIDGKLHTYCVQYLRNHYFPFFVGEWIFDSMFFVGRSDSDDEFSYPVFSCLLSASICPRWNGWKRPINSPIFCFIGKMLE